MIPIQQSCDAVTMHLQNHRNFSNISGGKLSQVFIGLKIYGLKKTSDNFFLLAHKYWKFMKKKKRDSIVTQLMIFLGLHAHRF
jgi:hypothetical protein